MKGAVKLVDSKRRIFHVDISAGVNYISKFQNTQYMLW